LKHQAGAQQMPHITLQTLQDEAATLKAEAAQLNDQVALLRRGYEDEQDKFIKKQTASLLIKVKEELMAKNKELIRNAKAQIELIKSKNP
jgi:hypothetical protein